MPAPSFGGIDLFAAIVTPVEVTHPGGAMHSSPSRTDFRFSLADRLGIAFATALIWLMLVGMAWAATVLLLSGEGAAALALGGAALLFLLLGNIILRDCLMRWRWRMLLGPAQAALLLPPGRLLFGRALAVAETVSFAAIRQIEWREEVTSSLGLTTINRVYGVRLKDGGVILLGEDRPIPKTSSYTKLMRDAADALAKAAGVPVRQLEKARGDGGFLTLWGARRPDWPGTHATP